MLIAVLSGFVCAIVAPLIARLGRGAGWVLAVLPFGLTLYFAHFVNRIAEGEVEAVSYEWVPSLNIQLSFYLDGLSLVMVLLVTGIGTLIVVYAGGYLAGHPQLGRFYMYLLIFMASMVGVVLAGNILTLFIFWELTSLSSFLLIGFKHEYEKSRKAALKALLVTGAGGLALLAGLIMLGSVAGTYEIAELLAQGKAVQNESLYVPMLILILMGAFTKSAQMPFHFWLPAAMEAPTPVSAYLHSATMVKAGVYLLARFSPILSGTDEWQVLVMGVGGVTMVLGAYIALKQDDLKRILAYTTISALGTLVFLLGIGSGLAAKGAMVFMVAHSLYKGTLFMTAGAVDHEAGTRDIQLLGGLRHKMPITFAATTLAAISMAGLPPVFGFIAKEVFYEASLEESLFILLTGIAVLGNMFMVGAAGLVVIKPFLGPPAEKTPKHPHEVPISMWLGPVVLGSLGLVSGLMAGLMGEKFIQAATNAVYGKEKPIELALWHGINTPLLLSVVTVTGGIIFYWGLDTVRNIAAKVDLSDRFGPEKGYEWGLDGMLAVANWQTGLLQHGYLRYYLRVIILFVISLVGYALLVRVDNTDWLRTSDIRFYEGVLVAVILLGTISAARATSRLSAVASLGTVGYGVALMFLLFGAPDLAMTQFAIETLTVILLVLVLYRLEPIGNYSLPRDKFYDAVIAGIGGLLVTIIVLIVTAEPLQSRLTSYFATNSYLNAQGRNVVNVILVDFRGFDTLVEVTVLSVAALGVLALLKLRLDPRDQTEPDEVDIEEVEMAMAE